MNPEQRLEGAKYHAAVIMCWFLALSMVFSERVMLSLAIWFGLFYSTYLLAQRWLLK